MAKRTKGVKDNDVLPRSLCELLANCAVLVYSVRGGLLRELKAGNNVIRNCHAAGWILGYDVLMGERVVLRRNDGCQKTCGRNTDNRRRVT